MTLKRSLSSLALCIWVLVACDDGASPSADGGLMAEEGCTEGAQAPCDTPCAGGTRQCEGGRWSTCEPPAEVCDGADNDCDGASDEGFELGQTCTVGIGACVGQGVRVCDEAGAVMCDAAAAAPSDEQCNGVDDDCDGSTDEGMDEGTACEAGLGPCTASGQIRCVQGALLCDAEPGQPGLERCNGIDDDCDGTADEDYLELGESCIAGIGLCARMGTVLCLTEDEAGCDATPGPQAEEQCNGADDDCDGEADEGFTQVGQLCVIGVGICSASGTWVCGPEGQEICTAAAGDPTEELCNGADDDCDGATDEDFDLGAQCSTGLGACAAQGVTVCDALEGTQCQIEAQPAPTPEVCNEIDDDCDGNTDEGIPGLGAQCVVGQGNCATEGVLRCGVGGVLTCDAIGGVPTPDVCDGLDNDCDGTVDEEFPGAGERCTAGMGACRAEGMLACDADGLGVSCTAVAGEPSGEQCNGIDDDCDGRTDENFPILGGVCGAGRGGCRTEGRFVCGVNGVTCDAEPGAPGEERCNGEDDDCDGRTDEGFQGVGGPCAVGVGQCAAEGVLVCTPQGDEVVCDAAPLTPGPELCDTLDNDCDGEADETFEVLGGVCVVGAGLCAAPGVWVCDEAGLSTRCDGTPGAPAEERCNVEDDDCDGVTDEGFPPIGEGCVVGRGACTAIGQWQCTADGAGALCDGIEGVPGVEACNAIDDDCDGPVDEDFPTLGSACSPGVGLCRREGVRTCNDAGDGVVCSVEAGAPSAEVCDGLDNDCDGATDEDWPDAGAACVVGVGVCRSVGVLVCAGLDGPQCDASAGVPSAEVCDGLDNDCDGEADEHLPALGTPCAVGDLCGLSGVWGCDAGAMRCVPDGGPQADGCVAPACEPDAAEPNDVPGAGERLELGSANTFNFCDDGEDWHRFEGRAGVDYRLAATPTEVMAGAIMIEIYDPVSGTLHSADQGTGPGGQALIPRFRPQRDGEWWVRATSLRGPVEGGEYTLHSGLACDDDVYEPDDVRDRASRIDVGEMQIRTLCGGPDWVRIEAEAGTIYALDAHDLRGGADPYLELYDAEGTLLRVDRDSGRRLAAQLWWQAQAEGSYFVRVLNRPAEGAPDTARYGAGRGYTLQLSTPAWPRCVSEPICPEGSTCLLGQCVPFSECGPDLREEDDAWSEAWLAQVGRGYALNHCADTEDWLRFKASEATRYDVEVYGVRGPRAVQIQLVDLASEEVLAEGVPKVDGAQISLWRPDSSSTFGVRVVETEPPEDDRRHTVVVRPACLDDQAEPDNAPWLASAIPLDGRVVARQLCQPDWMKFEIEEGTGLSLTLVGAGVSLEIRGRDGGATRLASLTTQDGLPTRLDWAPSASGEYFLRITSAEGTYGGQRLYTLTAITQPRAEQCVSVCSTRTLLCGERPVVDGGPRLAHLVHQGGSYPLHLVVDRAALQLDAGVDVTDLPGVLEVIPSRLTPRGVYGVRLKSPGALSALKHHPAVRRAESIYRDAHGRPIWLTGTVVARVRGDGGPSAAKALADDYGLQVSKPVSGLPGVWLMTVDPHSEVDAVHIAAAMHTDGAVRWAHPDIWLHQVPHTEVDDPLYPAQWHLGHEPGVEDPTLARQGIDVRAHRAWPLMEAGQPVPVAVFDDGFDLEHPDLPYAEDPERPGQRWLINAPANPEALLPIGLANHGTSVAGLALARTDNGAGVAGVCPQCTLVPAFGATTSSIAQLAEVFLTLRDEGVAVVNNSWGAAPGRVPVLDPDGVPGGPAVLPLADVLAEAIESVATAGRGGLGAVIVFSAGNGNAPVDFDPFSAADGVIAVGAIADDGLKSPYSNFGHRLWISAPSSGGETSGVLTTDATGLWGYSPGDYTDSFGGTSAAAPLVAGAAGAMISVNPELTAAQVKDLLRLTARPIDPLHGQWRDDGEGRRWSPLYGYGMLDVEAAVLAAARGCDPQVNDRCVPLGDACPDGTPGLFEGGCDGEGGPHAQCETCSFDRRCPGLCAVAPGAPEAFCLLPCEDGACPSGTCINGVCYPEAGCAPVVDEICDDADQDLDGHIDEGACPVVPLGALCDADRACMSGGLCVEGVCRAQCGPLEPCAGPGERCLAQVDRFGTTTGRRICLPVQSDIYDCLSACYGIQRQQGQLAVLTLDACVEPAQSCAQVERCF
ncbi:MAG: MopE-related protein [Bradymonadia bacterium]